MYIYMNYIYVCIYIYKYHTHIYIYIYIGLKCSSSPPQERVRSAARASERFRRNDESRPMSQKGPGK